MVEMPVEFELREQDSESGSGYERKMKSCACGRAEGFGRKGAGGAALTRGGSDSSGGAEGGGGAEDGADISGILDSGEDDDEGRAGATGSGE